LAFLLQHHDGYRGNKQAKITLGCNTMSNHLSGV